MVAKKKRSHRYRRAKSRKTGRRSSHRVLRRRVRRYRRRAGAIAADWARMAQQAWMKQPTNYLSNMYLRLGHRPNSWMALRNPKRNYLSG